MNMSALLPQLGPNSKPSCDGTMARRPSAWENAIVILQQDDDDTATPLIIDDEEHLTIWQITHCIVEGHQIFTK